MQSQLHKVKGRHATRMLALMLPEVGASHPRGASAALGACAEAEKQLVFTVPKRHGSGIMIDHVNGAGVGRAVGMGGPVVREVGSVRAPSGRPLATSDAGR